MAQDGRMDRVQCSLCHEDKTAWEIVPEHAVDGSVSELIREQNSGWTSGSAICASCLARIRLAELRKRVERESAALLSEEQQLEDDSSTDELVSKDIFRDYQPTSGEHISDAVAAYVGSWAFLGSQCLLLAVWIVVNTIGLLRYRFDPYPYIFLNLILSWIAALQAPLILMSQNRQNDRDRLRSVHDYRVNLKAEIEIRYLHRKLDQLLTEQWQHMLEIQQQQLQVLDQLTHLLPPHEE